MLRLPALRERLHCRRRVSLATQENPRVLSVYAVTQLAPGKLFSSTAYSNIAGWRA